MDGVVLLFSVGTVVLSGVLAGVIPAALFLRGPLLASLQDSSRGTSAGAGALRSRKGLLAIEVALTVVLLVSAGLLLKSYERLRSSDLGSATENMLTMRFSLPDAHYNTAEKSAVFYERLLPALRALPGIKAAGIATTLP